MLTVFNLTGTANERRIKIGIALDAAPLIKTISVFTVSIITLDPNVIDPKTGKIWVSFSIIDLIIFLVACSFRANLVSIPIPEKNPISESRLSCFPNYRERDKRQSWFFCRGVWFFLSLEHDATGIDPDFSPFDTHVSSDMTASLKVTGLGGGARGNFQVCARCPVRSSRMHLPHVCPWSRCVELYSRRCYHHAFVDPSTMDVYADHKDELEADLDKDIDLATILAQFTIAQLTIAHLDPLVATEVCMNPHSIDFILDKDDDNEWADFDNLLSTELKLRQLDAVGDRDETREILWERLEREKGLEWIFDLINHYLLVCTLPWTGFPATPFVKSP
jgi:hypothetical protein